MGNVAFTSLQTGKATDMLYIDVENFIGNSAPGSSGRMAKWTFAPGEVKKIDEGEINITTDNALLEAVKAGQLSISMTDVDSVTDLGVQNFLAGAVGQTYKLSSGSNTEGDIVALTSTSESAGKVAANGDQPFGVAAQSKTNGQKMRVINQGGFTATITATGTIAKGDWIKANTDGTGSKASIGDWVIGQATEAATNGTTFDITIDIKILVDTTVSPQLVV